MLVLITYLCLVTKNIRETKGLTIYSLNSTHLRFLQSMNL